MRHLAWRLFSFRRCRCSLEPSCALGRGTLTAHPVPRPEATDASARVQVASRLSPDSAAGLRPASPYSLRFAGPRLAPSALPRSNDLFGRRRSSHMINTAAERASPGHLRWSAGSGPSSQAKRDLPGARMGVRTADDASVLGTKDDEGSRPGDDGLPVEYEPQSRITGLRLLHHPPRGPSVLDHRT
jgi:hypothetical protein